MKEIAEIHLRNVFNTSFVQNNIRVPVLISKIQALKIPVPIEKFEEAGFAKSGSTFTVHN